MDDGEVPDILLVLFGFDVFVPDIPAASVKVARSAVVARRGGVHSAHVLGELVPDGKARTAVALMDLGAVVLLMVAGRGSVEAYIPCMGWTYLSAARVL